MLIDLRNAAQRRSRRIRRGLLATGLAAAIAAPASGDIFSQFYILETEEVALDSPGESETIVRGGAISPIGEDLLVIKPGGEIAVIRPDRSVAYLDGAVPMRRDAYLKHNLFEFPPNGSRKEKDWFKRSNFRVGDVLLRLLSPERWAMFVSHHRFADDCVRFRVSRTDLRRGADGAYALAAPWTTLFDAEPCFARPFGGQQAGGKMLADGDGHLLVLIGDHGRDGWRYPDQDGYPPALPQAADSHMGKLVRLNTETGEAEILAVGFRAPQGLARDASGNLWATEHGPRGGDELNLLKSGKNYGWPLVTLGRLYDTELSGGGAPPGADPGTVGLHDGFEPPVFSWVPSVGVSAVAVNDARHFPLWRDDLLIASLWGESDGGTLFRVRRNGTRAQYVERIEIGHRIRDIAWRVDGDLALLTDSPSVFFLSRSDDWCVEPLRRRGHAWALHCDDEALRRSETAWRNALEAVLSSAPAIQSEFDVWFDVWDGRRALTWVREECAPEDLAARFFYRVWPVNLAHLPEDHAPNGFADFSFAFVELPPPPPGPWDRRYAGRIDDKCIASVKLPQYDVSRIETGQFVDMGGDQSIIWKGDIVLPLLAKPARWRELYALALSREPLARSDFDVYLENGTLIYVGEKQEADDIDVAQMFFLHVAPADHAYLSRARRTHGFDNLDFEFYPSSCRAWSPVGDVDAMHVDEKCVIAAQLPTYPIARIATGRSLHDDDGGYRRLWEVKIDAPETAWRRSP